MVSGPRRTAPILRRWTVTFLVILFLFWLLSGQALLRLRRLRNVRDYFISRPSSMKQVNTGSFAIMAQMKNEAMGLREWLAHYTWQGVDTILLLDNGSTDDFQSIVADFPNAVVLSAPERYAQPYNFGEIGRPWLEERGFEYVLVTDLDNFFWSERSGQTMKDLVIETLHTDKHASQFTCPFHHFGSNGYDRQPKSISENVLREDQLQCQKFISAVLSCACIQGKTVPCPAGLLNFHYKAQSREYWAKVKLPRGDAVNEKDNGHRSWQQFDIEDRTGNATSDFRLRDTLRTAGFASGLC